MKPQRLFRRIGKSHELANRGDKLLDRLVMTAGLWFKLIELGSQVFVREHQLP
jgi:hypothetical protein